MRLKRMVTALLVAAGTAALAGPAGPPAATRVPVTDQYHGVAVVDDYRWLEDGNDPRIKEWSAAQNAWARDHLDRLPGREALRAEITRIRTIAVQRYGDLRFAGGTLFALKVEPPKQQPLLVALASEDDPASARVVVDPNVLDATGGTSIDWYEPSPDGARVAVSLSRGGSERGDARVFETATGREVGEAVTRVNYGTAGGSLAWDADGSGFFYTRYPREGERPAADLDFYVQVYHHRIGSAASGDRYELGRDFPRIAEIALLRSGDGRFVLANVQNGDSGEFSQHLRSPDGRWTRLTGFADRVVHAVFGPDDALYLLSRAGAPRGKVLRLPLGAGPPTIDQATTLVPEGKDVIEFRFSGSSGIVPARSRLYVTVGVGGSEEVRVFDLSAGREGPRLPTPPASAVFQVVARPGTDGVLFQAASFLDPTAWYRVEDGGPAVKVALSPRWPLNLADAEVTREWAVSRDGTSVPLSIVRHKGTRLDGNNPTLLTGYGGYAISQVPHFDPGLRVWLDRGGVFAVAGLRGGAEFGEEWHQAGRLTRKQNVFDDFIACAERLIQAGYTSPARLAIEGGSNGGLLMGAALTQRPDLFRAVVSHAGIYDMLRVELSANGAFNIPEFGTVKDPDQFRALYAYSPYHRVADGRSYPAVLFLTGANDPRVDPMQSRKMTARLQAAGAGLVLLRTSAASGHGFGTPLDEQIEAEVDTRAFLFDRLGIAR
jgi:prolyl oligopeptidase